MAVGATRYTEVGESTYLAEGDEAVVVVYDSTVTTPEDVAAKVAAYQEERIDAASVLRQTVRTASGPRA